MDSLLRAVLTSSDDFGTLSNSSQLKQDIKLANPHLHAALTSTQLKPRPAIKLTKSAVEQPPGETVYDKKPCQSHQKAPSRHSKLLEALISGVNHPTDDNLQNTESNGFKTEANCKKPESLNKSRLFLALTSPMVSLDHWSHQNNHNFMNQPVITDNKLNGIGHHDVQVNSRSVSSRHVSDQDNASVEVIKTEQTTQDQGSSMEFKKLSVKCKTVFNDKSNRFYVDSQTTASLWNCSGYKTPQTANPALVHVKSEPELIDNTDLSWKNIQDQNKIASSNNKLEFKMEANEQFSDGDDSENIGNNYNGLSECSMFKKENQLDDDDDDQVFSREYSFDYDPKVKVERENSRSMPSCYFSSKSAISANVLSKSPPPSARDCREQAEPSNLSTILQSTHKRKINDQSHCNLLSNEDERVASVPCKRKNVLNERNSTPSFVNKKSIPGDFFEADITSTNRESGIFQKKSNTDAQILRRVLTEGIGELRDSTNSQHSVIDTPKSFMSANIKDGHHSAVNLSPTSGSFRKPNTNQQEKSPIKSQILRAALTSVEPMVPRRKLNFGSHSSTRLKIPPTAIKNEMGASFNAIPPLCSNLLDNTDSIHASAIKNSREKIFNVFNNSNGQNSTQTADDDGDDDDDDDIVYDRPQKAKCQLLLAALTASDNSKRPNQNLNESAPKQTSSEILRAALNNAEKDSQGLGAKHSQLLRAALTAVDTNKAAKSWPQTNPKLNNSRLLRAVLTGKYIPDSVDHADYSKLTHHRKAPLSCGVNESKNDFSVSNTRLGTVARSYDIVEITPNLSGTTAAIAAATKKDKVQKVSPSVSCNTRSSGHSILRAVLTGAIDIPQRAHTSTKNNSVNHPELVANTNENHKRSEIVSSRYNTLQDKKIKNNNQSQPPFSSSLSSSSCSSSSSSFSENACKEQSCEYCGKYHSRSDSLWEYTSLFAGDTPHSCYMCHQSFSVTCLFLDHMDNHTDISSKYKCEFCGRHFKHVLSYIMCRLSHIDAQKAEKVSCNLCNCEFTCHNKLKQHTRIHAKDRFTCKFCSKEFHQRVNCYLHERDHVDNKMGFTCNMCGEKFALASDLKAHHQTHYAAELFRCSKCIKCFVTQKALKLHEETHVPVDCQNNEFKKVFIPCEDFESRQGGNSREKRKLLCEGCGLICGSRYSLAKHKATCGGSNPYIDRKFQVDMVSHSLVTIKD